LQLTTSRGIIAVSLYSSPKVPKSLKSVNMQVLLYSLHTTGKRLVVLRGSSTTKGPIGTTKPLMCDAARQSLQRQARQRLFCCASGQTRTTKTLPCAYDFAVRYAASAVQHPLPCACLLCRACILCRAAYLSVVRQGSAMRGACAVHASSLCAHDQALSCATHKHAWQKPCQAHQQGIRKHGCLPRGPLPCVCTRHCDQMILCHVHAQGQQ
jgi:hypothetical protein